MDQGWLLLGFVGLWVVGCGLWVVGCGLWVVGCGLWVVGCWVWCPVGVGVVFSWGSFFFLLRSDSPFFSSLPTQVNVKINTLS